MQPVIVSCKCCVSKHDTVWSASQRTIRVCVQFLYTKSPSEIVFGGVFRTQAQKNVGYMLQTSIIYDMIVPTNNVSSPFVHLFTYLR
jgi:hypothetical protein